MYKAEGIQWIWLRWGRLGGRNIYLLPGLFLLSFQFLLLRDDKDFRRGCRYSCFASILLPCTRSCRGLLVLRHRRQGGVYLRVNKSCKTQRAALINGGVLG